MLEIAFIGPQRKIIRFRINNKEVVYFDEMWQKGIQIYPYPKSLVRNLLKVNTTHLKAMGLLIHDANVGKNLEEYENCKTEEDLIDMIRKDALGKGLLEVK